MKPTNEGHPGASTPSEPLTGHEYDGIAEYDNPMPTWWRRTFWATVVFSLGYYVHYQLSGNGASVNDSYAADMREHRELLAAQALGEEMTEAGRFASSNEVKKCEFRFPFEVRARPTGEACVPELSCSQILRKNFRFR